MAQTANEIVEKHLAAMGGREALGKIRTRVSTGTVTVETAAGPILGHCAGFAKAPNKSRTLLTLDLTSLGAGKIINDQRFDGSTGFVIDPLNGNRDITGSQLDAMRNSGFPTVWLDYRARGVGIALAGKDTLGGRPSLRPGADPENGPARACLGGHRDVHAGQDVSAAGCAAGGAGRTDQEYSDFRTVDGVKVPFSVKSTSNGQAVTASVTDVKHNVEVDDVSFAKP